MPTIPGYDSQRNISSKPIAVLRQGEAEEGGKPLANVLEASNKFLQFWSDAHDVMQEAQAKKNLSETITDTKAAAALDSAVAYDENGKMIYNDASAAYFKKIDDARNAAINSIDNKGLANQLSLDFDLNVNIAKAEIAADFKKKELTLYKENLKIENQRLSAQILSADPVIRKKAIAERKELLDKGLMVGAITPSEYKEWTESAEELAVQYAVNSDPSVTEGESDLLKELRDPDGQFKDMDPKKRLSLVKELTQRISRNNAAFKRKMVHGQFINRVDTIKAIAQGKVAYDDPDLLMKVEQSDPQFAYALKKLKAGDGRYSLATETPSTGKQLREFSKTMDGIFGQLSEEQINNYLMSIFRGLNDSRLDMGQMGILSQLAADHADSIRTIPDEPKIKESHNIFIRMIEKIKTTITGDTAKEIAAQELAKKKYIYDLQMKAIEEESEKIRVETLQKLYPETVNLNGIPNYIYGDFLDEIYSGPNELNGEENASDDAEQGE